MNPLSSFTYFRRHRRWTSMLILLLALAVSGIYLFIGLAQETYIAPAYAINQYLDKFSLVQPDQVEALDPGAADLIRANPDVAWAIPQRNLNIKVANVGGAYFLFRLIGLREADTAAVLAQSGVAVKEGRLPQPGASEVALSEEIAASLDLTIGDTFDRMTDEKLYTNLVRPLTLVGVLSGEVRLGILSYEFLAADESYRDLAEAGLLVVARPGREAAVAEFLRRDIRNDHTKTYTDQSVSEQTARDQNLLFALGLPIALLVSLAITLVVGAANQLAFARRLPEFGTLSALGFTKGWLARRIVLETAAPALLGWGLGILLAWGGLAALSAAVYAPRGFAFTGPAWVPLPFVTLIPLVVMGFSFAAAMRSLGRMDPVAVVERGELSLEERTHGPAGRGGTAALSPLSSVTYYRRHVRQAVVRIGAAALLMVGTALLLFVFSAGADAMQPALNNLARMSAVSPNNQPLDAAVVAQIRAFPAVARVIPVYPFVSVKISIPPMFPDQPLETLCVSAEDMAYLVELYHLTLAEGRLPRPGTNEVVLPWAVAQNRSIQVGEVIGDLASPVYPGAPSLPSQLVVSGIFAPSASRAEETWLSFMSLEYADAYRESDLTLIVVPRPGEKAVLDDWLESRIAGGNRIVLTFRNQQAAFQKQMGTMLLTFSLMEGILVVMAALVLAGLHYFYLAGRRVEFGMLNALGFTRRQLVERALREAFFTTGAAWLAGMAVCAVVLWFLQAGVFDAAGLRLNAFNPLPWVATIPLPVAVMAAGALVTFGMLSRLDPVSVIERRD